MPCLVDVVEDPEKCTLNGPIARERLIAILESTFHNVTDVEVSTRSLLDQLNCTSSKHKFVVNVLKISKVDVDSTDLDIDNFTGFSWNEELDGAFHHQLEGDHQTLMVSVYWISL